MTQNIDVLAAFDVGTLHPRPIRFKLVEKGIKQTINIARINNIEWIGAGGRARVVYDCCTPANGKLISYRLKYYYSEGRWEIEI